MSQEDFERHCFQLLGYLLSVVCGSASLIVIAFAVRMARAALGV